MNKIQQVSFYFRILFQCFFYLSPIVLTLYWIFLPAQLGGHVWGGMISFIPEGMQQSILSPLSASTKLLGFLISLIPMFISEVILYFLIKLFKHYENKEIFTLESVNYINKIGRILLIGCILDPIHEALLSVALTWHNPPGQKILGFSFTGTSFIILMTSFLIILISWIMSEACQLKDEQQLTI